MAVKTGQKASVYVDVGGTNVQVLELREWSVSFSTNKPDSSAAGSDWTSHIIGQASWEGEATCIDADAYWLDMLFQQVVIEFYDDDADTNAAYSGTASLDIERGVSYDDVIETTITFTGSGALTHPTGV